MRSGGSPLSAADRARHDALNAEIGNVSSEIQALYDAMEGEQSRLSDAQNGQADAEKAYGDAAEAYSDAKQDKGVAEADWRAEKSDLRGRQQQYEQKVDAAEAWARDNNAYEREQLNPIWDKIVELKDRLSYQFDDWARKLQNRDEMAKYQAFSDVENRFDEILRIWHLANKMMAAAVMGLPGGAGSSLLLSFANYLQIPADILEPYWQDTQEQLTSQQNNYDAAVGRLQQRLADRFPDNEVQEAIVKYNETASKTAVEKDKFDQAAAAADAEKTDREAAYAASRTAKDGTRAVDDVMPDYQNRIRQKQSEIAAKEREQTANRLRST